MFIEIDPAGSEAIYIQLMKQIKKAIVRQEVDKGSLLPSVRLLAGDLGVNMHTVNKAYNLLADEGILAKSQKGYAVDVSNKVPEGFEEQMQERLEDLLVDIYIHDLPAEKVVDWTQEISKNLKREW